MKPLAAYEVYCSGTNLLVERARQIHVDDYILKISFKIEHFAKMSWKRGFRGIKKISEILTDLPYVFLC